MAVNTKNEDASVAEKARALAAKEECAILLSKFNQLLSADIHDYTKRFFVEAGAFFQNEGFAVSFNKQSFFIAINPQLGLEVKVDCEIKQPNSKMIDETDFIYAAFKASSRNRPSKTVFLANPDKITELKKKALTCKCEKGRLPRCICGVDKSYLFSRLEDKIAYLKSVLQDASYRKFGYAHDASTSRSKASLEFFSSLGEAVAYLFKDRVQK